MLSIVFLTCLCLLHISTVGMSDSSWLIISVAQIMASLYSYFLQCDFVILSVKSLFPKFLNLAGLWLTLTNRLQQNDDWALMDLGTSILSFGTWLSLWKQAWASLLENEWAQGTETSISVEANQDQPAPGHPGSLPHTDEENSQDQLSSGGSRRLPNWAVT